MGLTVSFIIPTHNRKSKLRDTVDSVLEQEYSAKEVIVVSDSTDGTANLFSEEGRFNLDEVRFHNTSCSLNPSSARNIGIEMATGDVYVFLDDDAVMVDSAATGRIVDAFAASDDLGILAFCIRDHTTGELNAAEFPHPNRTPTPDERFQTTYFVGAGCAIRPEAIGSAGDFPECFDRFEEIDLSFRIIDAGYRIEYFPEVVIEHKNDPVDQRPPNSTIRYDLENRLMMSVRNFPWRFVLSSLLIWSGYTLYRAGLDPRPLLVGLASFVRQLPRLLGERSVLGSEAMAYIKQNGDRRYY